MTAGVLVLHAVSRRPGLSAALVDYYGGGEPEAGALLPPVLGHYGELDDDTPIVPRSREEAARDGRSTTPRLRPSRGIGRSAF